MKQSGEFWENLKLYKDNLEIIQINMGNKCNQSCIHCHINASPSGENNMNRETAENIINKLVSMEVNNIEFTGGAPEMNPYLSVFLKELSKVKKKLFVRTNLTILDSPKYSHYLDLFKKHQVKLIASLPGMSEEVVDKQRGKDVFQKSIKVLKKLNNLGYGADGYLLNLVYNPNGDFLPPEQYELEEKYKKILKEKYDVYFNNLITIVNSPINKFKYYLRKNGELNRYFDLLKENYNEEALKNIMCRRLISVDYSGNVYDCDFNLALKKRIKNYENLKFWNIDFANFKPLISFDKHCYACVANLGSSCHGVLLNNRDKFETTKSVKEYYGEKIKQTADLKTNVCCEITALPERIKEVLSLVNDEIKMKYYGCGSPIPLCLEGLKVLDVGCGTGRDVYILSKLVRNNGFVYGIDMTEKQLNVAKKYIMEQTNRFGYKKPNVEFILDYIENVNKHFKKESLDLVTSNCVINLTEDKEIVIKQIYDILKFGGEFYFSDIYTDCRSPEKIRTNPILYGECLGGALYYKDFERIAKKVGFIDPRIVNKREINITNPEVKKLIGNIRFCSITYRLWKLKGLEDGCEDFGHIAIYDGRIKDSPLSFELDGAHIFQKNKPEKICGNTALMLSQTRFSRYFKIIGNFTEHFGEFRNCSSVEDKNGTRIVSSGGFCC